MFHLLQCYDDYCMAVEVHSVQASPTTYANLVESHNDYVQQLHAANGMVDQVRRIYFKVGRIDLNKSCLIYEGPLDTIPCVCKHSPGIFAHVLNAFLKKDILFAYMLWTSEDSFVALSPKTFINS